MGSDGQKKICALAGDRVPVSPYPGQRDNYSTTDDTLLFAVTSHIFIIVTFTRFVYFLVAVYCSPGFGTWGSSARVNNSVVTAALVCSICQEVQRQELFNNWWVRVQRVVHVEWFVQI